MRSYCIRVAPKPMTDVSVRERGGRLKHSHRGGGWVMREAEMGVTQLKPAMPRTAGRQERLGGRQRTHSASARAR